MVAKPVYDQGCARLDCSEAVALTQSALARFGELCGTLPSGEYAISECPLRRQFGICTQFEC